MVDHLATTVLTPQPKGLQWVARLPHLRDRVERVHGPPERILTLRSSPFPTPNRLRFAHGSPVNPGW